MDKAPLMAERHVKTVRMTCSALGLWMRMSRASGPMDEVYHRICKVTVDPPFRDHASGLTEPLSWTLLLV
jgi:hypothetical protein